LNLLITAISCSTMMRHDGIVLPIAFTTCNEHQPSGQYRDGVKSDTTETRM